LSQLATVKPFLKWAGGKRQLLPELVARVERVFPFRRYHEPFLGGGALFFGLCNRGWLGRFQARLSDANGNLAGTYEAVREDVARVVGCLRAHESGHSEEYYYGVRGCVPADPFEGAARIIYLNRTCYNGLYRENRKGEFNVPFGRYKNPLICDEDNLRAVAGVLKRARIERRHFAGVLDVARPGDLVYFDPPYHPVSKTSSFTAYDKGGFGEESQRELACVVKELAERDVKVVVSNSMTRFVQDLYGSFRIDAVYATRSVNSRATRRGKVAEALITSF
jgi:DNA adenine methylase